MLMEDLSAKAAVSESRGSTLTGFLMKKGSETVELCLMMMMKMAMVAMIIMMMIGMTSRC